MAQILNRVQPGEVITAEMWNLVVDAVNELLEAGQTTGIKIAAMVPVGTANEPLRIGALIQITGQSFGFSLGQASVAFEGSFGNVIVPQQRLLVGSSDTRLLLIMPPIPGITQNGMTLTMRVSNGISSDIRSVFVMPIVITLHGDIFVNWRSDVSPNPQPNPIVAGQRADFAFHLQTGLNMPATFDLIADIPNATVAIPAGLIDSIQFIDALSGTALPNKQIELGRNDTRNIIIRIPLLPATWVNQSFALQVTATSGNVTNAETRSFTVGVAVTPPDPNIVLQQTGWLAINPTTGDDDPSQEHGVLDGTTIKVKPDWQLILQFNVQFKQVGIYDLTVQPQAGTTLTGWALQLVNTPASVTITAVNESRFVQFGVTALASAVATGSFVFRIKRQGATADQTKEYNVQLWQ